MGNVLGLGVEHGCRCLKRNGCICKKETRRDMLKSRDILSLLIMHAKHDTREVSDFYKLSSVRQESNEHDKQES
jgi:hypothetical protein